MREQESDADNYLQIVQDRGLYAKHPYANDVYGTPETISVVKGKGSSAFITKRCFKHRADCWFWLVIWTRMTSGKKVTAAFGKLPVGKYQEKPFPPLDFSKPTLDIAERDLPTNYVQGVFSAPSLDSPDYSAMRVAMAILQSLVYEEVRLKRQLSYAPDAELSSSAANSAKIYVTAVDANQAVEVMLNEINNLRTRTLTDEMIEGIGGHFLTLYYLDQQTNAAQAGELGKYELFGGGWRNSFTFLDQIRKVKADDVREVSQKYMGNVRFAVVGNPASINKKIFLPEEEAEAKAVAGN